MKQKQVYWLTERLSPEVKQKTEFLNRHNIVSNVAHSMEQLQEIYSRKRVSSIVVCDDLEPSKGVTAFNTFSSNPEFSGIRVVLAFSNPKSKIVHLAYSHGIRDIIPVDLDNQAWLKRFIFSTSGSDVPLEEPIPRVSLRNISAINIPARIVWVSNKHLWIESKVAPPKGTQIKVKGPIANFFDVKTITLDVEKHYDTDLTYRYSEALLCRWHISGELESRKDQLVNILRSSNKHQSPYKAFLAFQAPAHRQKIESALSESGFKTVVALHRQSFIYEPKFFNPDIIIIEDSLTRGENFKSFEEMLKNCQSRIPVLVVYGKSKPDLSSLEGDFPIHYTSKITSSLPKILIKKFRLEEKYAAKPQSQAVYIDSKNHNSYAEIVLPARLTQLNPSYAKIIVPYSTSPFGLCKIESPIIKKSISQPIIGKIARTFEVDNPTGSPGFTNSIDCFFCNTNQQARNQISDTLINLVSENFGFEPVKAKTSLVQIDIDDSPVKSELPSKIKKVTSKVEAATREFSWEGFASKIQENIKIHKKEIYFTLFFLCLIAIVIYAVANILPEAQQQGRIFSDQFKKFDEMN